MHLDHGQVEVISNEMAQVLRHKTGAERLAIASQMFASARRMIADMLHAEHPEWDDQQVNQEVARRLSHGAV